MTGSALGDAIPIGDIQFYDNYVPGLDTGNWSIEVEQTIEEGANSIIGSDKLGSKQYFSVSAPQVHVEHSAIVNQFPPGGTTGLYAEVLPHVVLSDPMLPWERTMNGSSERQPWLALLVFDSSELMGAHQSDTRLTGTTVKHFMLAEAGVLKPALTIEEDIDPQTQACNFIKIGVDTFHKLTPRLEELRYLTHCRKVNTGDKAILGINEHGLFSVVVANRFPERPIAGAEAPTESIVHLVSMEGFEAVLTDSPDFGSHTTVDILTLASWTFQTLPDSKEDFKGLFDNIVATESTGSPPKANPEKFWLRAPLPQLSGNTGAMAETTKRIQDGFVPLTYHTRTGAETFSWYRGPLTPLLTTHLNHKTPFFTSDAALTYDSAWGVFDTSLAAAWQIGRATALSDKTFGKLMMDFRKKMHRITDTILHRLQSAHFSAADIAAAVHDSKVEDEFDQLLNEQLLADMGKSTSLAHASVVVDATPPASAGSAKQALENVMKEAEVQQALLKLVADDVEPIAKWLVRLVLLYPVPFNHLVSDKEMLPVESLRFFYVDDNWTNAMLDGALTLGLQSSRDTFCHELTHSVLKESARDVAKLERQKLTGIEPDPTEIDEGLVAGFLLRSSLVSGWPNLAVRPRKGQQSLKILRMDHLSKNVLFCLVAGVPDYVEFDEPQEALCFGVEEGALPLRTLTANDPKLGVQLNGNPTLAIYDLTGQQPEHLRDTQSRVLNIAPSSHSGLIKGIQAANNTAPNPFGPGALALQMVKSPEAIKFQCKT